MIRSWRLRIDGPSRTLEQAFDEPPIPGPGEVVVAVRHVSLNARDLMIRNGPSPYGDRTGLIPASDAAGVVARLGPGVDGWKAGDEVVAPFRLDWREGAFRQAQMTSDLGGGRDGVLTQEIALPADRLVGVPGDLGLEAACTLPCAGVTAWRALLGGRGLQPGMTVLVQGSGGVSVFALQIAAAHGCRVIATTGSPGKAERLRQLGAGEVIERGTAADWPAEVRRLTGGRGADRIVEVGGAGTLEQSFAAAADAAEIALVGLLDDPMRKVSPLPVMSRMLNLRGVSVGSRADLADLVAFSTGRFAPVIDSRFAFDEVPAAFARLASRRHVGKVVIDVG